MRVRPGAIVADWDLTVTVEDTIHLVAQAAYSKKPQFTPFSHYSNIYSNAYKAYATAKPTNIAEEKQFQRAMINVENASISAIEREGLFEGLSKADFAAQAPRVAVRSGVINFFRQCQSHHVPIIILSVNWTSILIEEVLKSFGIKAEVIVNEFEFDGEVTTGKWLQPGIRTGLDKLKIIEDLKRQYNEIVYIGDSSTDTLSLLEANWGVVYEGGLAANFADKIALNEASAPLTEGLYSGNWHEIAKFFA